MNLILRLSGRGEARNAAILVAAPSLSLPGSALRVALCAPVPRGMAQIVRVWRVTPPAGLEHPKTEMLRTAARLGTIAVRARKLDSAGVMYLVARGKSEDLAAFAANLHHKQKDEGWAREELLATAADEALLEGGGTSIVRTDDAHMAGADSSGSKAPEALPAASVDTGSTAS